MRIWQAIETSIQAGRSAYIDVKVTLSTVNLDTRVLQSAGVSVSSTLGGLLGGVGRVVGNVGTVVSGVGTILK